MFTQLFVFISLTLVSVTLGSEAAGATWYQGRDFKGNDLFKRQDEESLYPEVGTKEWSRGFPTSSPFGKDMPQAWKDALQTALDAGKIPDVPRTTQTGRSAPVYPNGLKPTDPKICSGTYKCRQPEDIWDAPEGVFGVAFDDGPQPSTGKLIDFLENNDLPKVTQFMIGQNILRNPKMFKKSFEFGNDIAVHGYTHRYLTTLSNEDVVAELGWTMQLIANSTDGRIPRYMRAPYGDADMRIRAIAKEIFGLTQVFWNQDSEDWAIVNNNKQAKSKAQKKLISAAKGPKSPGLIILEHEISSDSVQVFIDSYQTIKNAGWKLRAVTSLKGSPYRNVDFGKVRSDNIVISHADPEESKPEEPAKDEEEAETEEETEPAEGEEETAEPAEGAEETEEPAEGAEETEEPATEGEEETEEPAEGEEAEESTTTTEVEESSSSTSKPTSTSTSAGAEETSTEETTEEEESTEESSEEGKSEEQKKEEEKKDNAGMQVKAAGPLFTVLCVVAVLLI